MKTRLLVASAVAAAFALPLVTGAQSGQIGRAHV